MPGPGSQGIRTERKRAWRIDKERSECRPFQRAQTVSTGIRPVMVTARAADILQTYHTVLRARAAARLSPPFAHPHDMPNLAASPDVPISALLPPVQVSPTGEVAVQGLCSTDADVPKADPGSSSRCLKLARQTRSERLTDRHGADRPLDSCRTIPCTEKGPTGARSRSRISSASVPHEVGSYVISDNDSRQRIDSPLLSAGDMAPSTKRPLTPPEAEHASKHIRLEPSGNARAHLK